ncbi:uracil-DNA glycosylase [Cupriavidus gilardii]|uniref:uracil-DNA glycosylase family protein n=1 Tax=Cupriavidus gilardii TaxID=82541 RepID=UPI0021BE588D|nr:uracil-DNA glycosylase family protein [Cupriavidus gilardii]MCT9118379.1 uracil-DNA glycosylase [Cupriavidus gilardii]
MNRRALFLEALGIGTEWVPRHAAAVQAEPEAAAATGLPERQAPGFEGPSHPAPSHPAPDHPAPDHQAPDHQAPRLDAARATTAPAPAPTPRQPVIPIVADDGLRLPLGESVAQPADDLAALDWQALEARVAGCTACQLCGTRTRTVFGVGDREADWMLVGEAPGENEDRQGEPFVGQAGKLLDNMLASLQLARGRNVFIANVLKCRPPGNRNPEPAEVEQCEPFLRRQIALVRPRLIVVLGRFAAQTLLRTTTPISKLRGTVHRYEGIPVVVTYHPAYLLRTLSDKARAWEDLCLARDVYRQSDPAAPADLLDSGQHDSPLRDLSRAGVAGGGDAGAGH